MSEKQQRDSKVRGGGGAPGTRADIPCGPWRTPCWSRWIFPEELWPMGQSPGWSRGKV